MVEIRRESLKNENANLGVQIAIANLKDEAISLGFDFPTQDIATVELETLYDFYLELENFVSENRTF
jgi:hypothetical protein